MRKFLASLFVLFAATPSLATFPQDDFRNYLIVLVHGLGGDTNIIGNRNGAKAYPKHTGWLETSSYFERPEYNEIVGDPRDNSEEYFGGLFEFLTDSLGVDSSHVRYYEMSRACNAFYNEKPGMASTSRELGDRNYDNPGADRWPRALSNTIQLRFGLEKDPRTGQGLSWLQQALVDWEKTWRSRNPEFPINENIPDSVMPKKYILVGHSMGGLTIRSYLAADFYQGDVERVVTIASPASGSEIVGAMRQFGLRKGDFLENDWNQRFLATTLVEGVALFFASQQGNLDKTISEKAAISTRRSIQEKVMDKVGLVLPCSDLGNCDFRDWVRNHPNQFGNLTWVNGYGFAFHEDPLGPFLFNRTALLMAKVAFLDQVMDKFGGHDYDNERGVQQLEPLETNVTGAISALNEFRFPENSRYIPKMRLSAIEDVPTASRPTFLQEYGVVVEEAVTVLSMLFPAYANSVVGALAGTGALLALDYGDDPHSFTLTQALVNDITSKIGFYNGQLGDGAVPSYSGEGRKGINNPDQIELMKQADFGFRRIAYDNVDVIGQIMDVTSKGCWAINNAAKYGLLPGPWYQMLGVTAVSLAGGLSVKQYVPRFERWMNAHGQAIGYTADRRAPRVNSIGQSIIETQLWDAPSVSITAMRRADAAGGGVDMFPDTTLWAKRFSVGNRLGVWKEDVFKNFLTFRKRDSKGNRDYAFMPAITIPAEPDTMRFIVEDFQIDSLRAVMVSVNYGPWEFVRLRLPADSAYKSMVLDHHGNYGAFYMTKGDLDLKEGENDLRIVPINRYGLGPEQHANIQLFTTPTTIQPIWPLDNVGITGGRTGLELETRPVYDEQTDHLKWHVVLLGQDSARNIDSVVVPAGQFTVDPIPSDPGAFKIRSLSDLDLTRFVRPGQESQVLIRVTVTPVTAAGIDMKSYSINLHVVLDQGSPLVEWVHTKDTLQVSRAWIDSAKFVARFADQASQLQDVKVVAVSPTGQTLQVDSALALASGAVRETKWNLLWNGSPVQGRYRLVVSARDPSYRNLAEFRAWRAYSDSGKPLDAAVYDRSRLNVGADTLWLDIDNTAPEIQTLTASTSQPRFDGTADASKVRLASRLAVPELGADLEYRFVRTVGAGGAGADTVVRGGTSDSLGHDTLVLAWDGTGITVPDGIWSVSERATDAWGNSGSWKPLQGSLTIDHTAPVAQTQWDDAHTVTASTTLRAEVTAREPNDREELKSVNALTGTVVLRSARTGQEWPAVVARTVDATGLHLQASLSLAGRVSGAYVWETRIADASGNTTTDSRAIVIDQLPTEITSPVPGAQIQGPFTVFGSADDPAKNDRAFQKYTLECSVDLGSTWSGTCASVPDGTANVSVRTVDRGILGWITPPSGASALRIRLTSTDGEASQQVERDVVLETGAVPEPFLAIPDTLKMVSGGLDSLVRAVAIPWGLQNLTSTDSASVWSARFELLDPTGVVQHRQSVEGVRFTPLFGMPQVLPDSSGVYVFHESGGIYRIRVVSRSANDSVRFNVMGMGGVRTAPGVWRVGADWTGVVGQVDDGQNMAQFQADGKAGVWEMRLEFLGSQAFFVGSKLVFAGRTPWHAFRDSQYVSLDNDSFPAPVFAGASCRRLGAGYWDVGNAPSAWNFDASPMVGAGVLPDGRYVARLRVTRQTASQLADWGEFNKTVVLRKTIPLVRSGEVDPPKFFPYASSSLPAPRSATWSLDITQPVKLNAEVVDSAGNKIRTLVTDSTVPAGRFLVSWNGSEGDAMVGLARQGTYHLNATVIPVRLGEPMDPVLTETFQAAPVVLGEAGWIPANQSGLRLRLPDAVTVGGKGWLVDDGTWDREALAMLHGQYYERVPFQARLRFSGSQKVPYYPMERYTLRLNRHFDRIAYDVVNVTRMSLKRVRQKRILLYLRCQTSYPYRLADFDNTVQSLEDAETENGTVFDGINWVSRPIRVDYNSQNLHANGSNGTDWWVARAKIRYFVEGVNNYAIVFPKGGVSSKALSDVRAIVQEKKESVDQLGWEDTRNLILKNVTPIEVVESGIDAYGYSTVKKPDLAALVNEENIDSAANGGGNLLGKEKIEQGNFDASMKYTNVDWNDSQDRPLVGFFTCFGGATTVRVQMKLRFRESLWNPRYGRNSLVNRYVTFDPKNDWLMEQLDEDGFASTENAASDDAKGFVAPGYPFRLSLPHLNGPRPDGQRTLPLSLYYNGVARKGSDNRWICDSSLCSRDESYRIDVLDPRPDDQVYANSEWDIQAKTCIQGGDCSSLQIPSQIPAEGRGKKPYVWRVTTPQGLSDSMVLSVGITKPTNAVGNQYGLVTAPWPMRQSWIDSVSRGSIVPEVGLGVNYDFGWKQGGIVRREAGVAVLDPQPSFTTDTVLARGTLISDTLRRNDQLPASLQQYGAPFQVRWPSYDGGKVIVGSDTLLTPQLSYGFKVAVEDLPDTIGVMIDDQSQSATNLVSMAFYRKGNGGAPWDPRWDTRMDPVLGLRVDRDGDSLALEESDAARPVMDARNFITDLDQDSLRGEDVRGVMRQRIVPDLRQIQTGIPFQLSSLYPKDSLAAWLGRNPGKLSIPTAWRLDAQNRLVANPDVVLQGVQTRLAHLDGRTQGDVELVPGAELELAKDADKVFTIKLAPMSQAPSRRLLIEGVVPRGEYMLYAVDPSTGNVTTIAHRPPELSSMGRDGLLGTLDITSRNGATTLVLAQKLPDGNWQYDSKTVMLGAFVPSATQTVVEGGFGRIELSIPAGSFLRDTVVSVTPVPRSTVKLGTGTVAVEPRGYVIEVRPSPVVLQPGKKAKITARFQKAEMLSENGSLTDLSMWYLSDDGRLVELQNTVVTPIGDLVVVSGETDHFSRFAVLSKTRTYAGTLQALDAADGLVPPLSRTGQQSIQVKAVAGAKVGIWEMRNDTAVRVGEATCDAQGVCVVQVGLTVGKHVLVAKVDSLCSGSTCSVVRNSPSILDTIEILSAGAASIRDLRLTPAVFSPDGDGIDDSVVVSVSTPLPGTLNLEVVGAQGQILWRRGCLVVDPAKAECAWNGYDQNGVLALGKWRVRARLVDPTGWTSNQLEGEVVCDTGRTLIYDEAQPTELQYGVGQDRADGADTTRYRADGSGWDGSVDSTVQYSGRRSLVVRSTGDDPVVASEGWTPANSRVPDSSAVAFAWRKSSPAARMSFVLSTGDGRMFEAAEGKTWFGRGLELPVSGDSGWHRVAVGTHLLGRWEKMGRYDTVPAGRIARLEFGVKPSGTDANAWVDLAGFAPYGKNSYLKKGDWNPIQTGWKSAQVAHIQENGLTLTRRQAADESTVSIWSRDTVHGVGRGWVLEVDTTGDWAGASLRAKMESSQGQEVVYSWPSVVGEREFPAWTGSSTGVAMSLGGTDSLLSEGSRIQGLQIAIRSVGDAAKDTVWRSVGVRRWSLVRDVVAPEVEIVGISDGISSRLDLTPVVSFRDAHLWRTSLMLDNAPWTSGDAVHTEGQHLLVAKATDLAGNTTIKTVRFQIDRTPPVVALSSPENGASVSTLLRVSGIIDDPTVSQVVVRGGIRDTVLDVRDGYFRCVLPLAMGASRVVEVSSTDAAGNVGSSSRTVSVDRIADVTAPIIRIHAPGPGSHQNPVQVVGEVVDEHLAYVQVAGKDVETDRSGRFATLVDMPIGASKIGVKAVDSSGNIAIDSIAVDVFDTAAPDMRDLRLERNSDGEIIAKFSTDKNAYVRAMVRTVDRGWSTMSVSSGVEFTLPLGAWRSGSRPEVQFVLSDRSDNSRTLGPWPIPEVATRISVKPIYPPYVNHALMRLALDNARPGDTLELAAGVYRLGDSVVPAGVVFRGVSSTECVVYGYLRPKNGARLENFTLVEDWYTFQKSGVVVDSTDSVSMHNVILRGFAYGVDVRGSGAAVRAEDVTSIHRGFGFRVRTGARGNFVRCLAWSTDYQGESRIGFKVDHGGQGVFQDCRASTDEATPTVVPRWLWKNGPTSGVMDLIPVNGAELGASGFDRYTPGFTSISARLPDVGANQSSGWTLVAATSMLPANLLTTYGSLRFLVNRRDGLAEKTNPDIRIWMRNEIAGETYPYVRLTDFLPAGLDEDPVTWQEVVIPLDTLGFGENEASQSQIYLKFMDHSGTGQPEFLVDEIGLLPRWAPGLSLVSDPIPTMLYSKGNLVGGVAWSTSDAAEAGFQIADGIEGDEAFVAEAGGTMRFAVEQSTTQPAQRFLQLRLGLPGQNGLRKGQKLQVWTGDRDAMASDPVILPETYDSVSLYRVRLDGTPDLVNVRAFAPQSGEVAVQILSAGIADTVEEALSTEVEGIVPASLKPVGFALLDEHSPRIELTKKGREWKVRVASDSTRVWFIEPGRVVGFGSEQTVGGIKTATFTSDAVTMYKQDSGDVNSYLYFPGGLMAPVDIASPYPTPLKSPLVSGCFTELDGSPTIAGACKWGGEVLAGQSLPASIAAMPSIGGKLFVAPGIHQLGQAIDLKPGQELIGSGWDKTRLADGVSVNLERDAVVSGTSIAARAGATSSLFQSNGGKVLWSRIDRDGGPAWAGAGQLGRVTINGGDYALALGRADWVSARHSNWRAGRDAVLNGSIFDSSVIDAFPTNLSSVALPSGQMSMVRAGRELPIWSDPWRTIQDAVSPHLEVSDRSGIIIQPELGSRIQPGSKLGWSVAEFGYGWGTVDISAPVWIPDVRVRGGWKGAVVLLQIDDQPPQVQILRGRADSLPIFRVVGLTEGSHRAKVWISGVSGTPSSIDVSVSYLDHEASGRGSQLLVVTEPRRTQLSLGEMIPLKVWADTGALELIDVTKQVAWTITEGAGNVAIVGDSPVLRAPDVELAWVGVGALWNGVNATPLRLQVVSTTDIEGPRVLNVSKPRLGQGLKSRSVDFQIEAWDRNGCAAWLEMGADTLLPLAVAQMGTGEFRIEGLLNLPEGRNRRTLILRDTLGNQTRWPVEFVVDTRAPAITPIDVPYMGNAWSSRKVVTGQVDDPVSEVVCAVRGVGLTDSVSAVVDQSGYFSCPVSFPVGASTLAIHARDSLGNSSDWELKIDRSISSDKEAPWIAFSIRWEGRGVTSSSILVEGVVEDASGIGSAMVEGMPLVLTPAGMGRWTFQVTLSLSTDGAREFIFRAVDDAGNAASASARVVRDMNAPTVVISSSPLALQPQISLFGTIDDPSIKSVDLKIDGGATTTIPVVSGEWTHVVAVLETRDYGVVVEARDSLGNVGRASQTLRRITKDPTPPVLTLLSPSRIPDTVFVGQIQIRFKATDEDLAKVWFGAKSLPVGAGEWTETVSLSAGLNRFGIAAEDADGNRSEMVAQVEWIDTTGPVFLSWSQSDTLERDTLFQVFRSQTAEMAQTWLQIVAVDSLPMPYAAVLYAIGDTSFSNPLDTISIDSLDALDDAGLFDTLTPVRILTELRVSDDTLIFFGGPEGVAHLVQTLLPPGVQMRWRWKAVDNSDKVTYTPWSSLRLVTGAPRLSILSGPADGDTVKVPDTQWSIVGFDEQPGLRILLNGASVVVDSTIDRGAAAGVSRFAHYATLRQILSGGENRLVFTGTDRDGLVDSLAIKVVYDTSKLGGDYVVFDPIGDGFGSVDFGEVHVAHASDSLYFLIHLAGNPPPSFSGATNFLYVDLDGKRTTGNSFGYDARWKLESLGQNDDGSGSWMHFEVWKNGYWAYVGGNASWPQSNPFVNFAFNFKEDAWTPNITAAGDQILPSGRIAKADGGALELAVHVSNLDSVRFYLEGQGDMVGTASTPFVYKAQNMRHITVDGRTNDWGVPPNREVKAIQALTRTTQGDAGNQLRVELSLWNTGTLPLDSLVARYWFSVAELSGFTPLIQGPYYSPYGETVRLVRGNTIPGYSRLPSDIWVAEVVWPGRSLGAGNQTQDAGGNSVSFDIHLSNWGSWDRTNDWSRNSSVSWIANDHVTVHARGVQLWGQSPIQPPAYGPNLAPVAQIRGASTSVVGQQIALDTAGTIDPDNGPLPMALRWVLVETDSVLATTPRCTLSLPLAGVWHVRLEANDGDLVGSAVHAITVSGQDQVTRVDTIFATSLRSGWQFESWQKPFVTTLLPDLAAIPGRSLFSFRSDSAWGGFTFRSTAGHKLEDWDFLEFDALVNNPKDAEALMAWMTDASVSRSRIMDHLVNGNAVCSTGVFQKFRIGVKKLSNGSNATLVQAIKWMNDTKTTGKILFDRIRLVRTRPYPKVVVDLVPSSRSLVLQPGQTILRIPASSLVAVGWEYSQIRLQLGAQDGKMLAGSLVWPGGSGNPSGWTWATQLGKLPKNQAFEATLTLPEPRTLQVQWWAE